MIKIDWDSYKREDGSFNLLGLYDYLHTGAAKLPFAEEDAHKGAATTFIEGVEATCSITSKEVAAAVLTQAYMNQLIRVALGQLSVKKEEAK